MGQNFPEQEAEKLINRVFGLFPFTTGVSTSLNVAVPASGNLTQPLGLATPAPGTGIALPDDPHLFLIVEGEERLME
jgi:hypothetical protein